MGVNLVKSEIQLCCNIAMDIVTDGLFHELLRDTETLCQIPDLTTAFCYRFIQRVLGYQLGNCPFVSTVFVTLPQIIGGVPVVETSGQAVSQLMAHMDPLQHITVHEPDDAMIEVAITAMKLVIPEEKGKDAW